MAKTITPKDKDNDMVPPIPVIPLENAELGLGLNQAFKEHDTGYGIPNADRRDEGELSDQEFTKFQTKEYSADLIPFDREDVEGMLAVLRTELGDQRLQQPVRLGASQAGLQRPRLFGTFFAFDRRILASGFRLSSGSGRRCVSSTPRPLPLFLVHWVWFRWIWIGLHR